MEYCWKHIFKLVHARRTYQTVVSLAMKLNTLHDSAGKAVLSSSIPREPVPGKLKPPSLCPRQPSFRVACCDMFSSLKLMIMMSRDFSIAARPVPLLSVYQRDEIEKRKEEKKLQPIVDPVVRSYPMVLFLRLTYSPYVSSQSKP